MYTPDHALQAVVVCLLTVEVMEAYEVRYDAKRFHQWRTQLVIAVGAMIGDLPLFVGAAINVYEKKAWNDFTPFFTELKHGAHSVIVWAYLSLILLKLVRKYKKELTHYAALFITAVYLHMLVDFMTHGRELFDQQGNVISHGHSGWWPLCEPCSDGINLGTVLGFWNYMPEHGVIPRWQELLVNGLCLIFCAWAFPRFHRRRSAHITSGINQFKRPT